MAVRWILSAGMLFIVWHHAHWSVALMLTLLVIKVEIEYLFDDPTTRA